MNYKGIPYLQNLLAMKRLRGLLRYGFYEMKNITFDFGISSPPELKYWNSVVGWCAKGVDALADRLDVRSFKNDVFNLTQIFDLNNKDILFDSAMVGALINSCDFIYVSEDKTGFPRLQVIDGTNATGILDPITNLLTEGYAVLERDNFGIVTKEAYFTFEYTAYYENGNLVDTRPNKAPYPCLVPIIYKPDSYREFGHSRISRACMSIVGSALRTIKRSEISAEFYSYPQKWVTGVDQNAEQMDKIRCFGSLAKAPIDSRGAGQKWWMVEVIPFSLLGLKSAPKSLRCNFYKCGDKCDRPHFLSWSPIDKPEPNFHCPEFFGEVILV